MNIIVLLFQILAVVVVTDIFWYKFAYPKYYEKMLNRINNKNTRYKLTGAVASWVLLTLGIWYFGVYRASNLSESLINGAILGLLVYGIHNANNYREINRYSSNVIIVDMMKGIVICAGLAVIFKMMSQKSQQTFQPYPQYQSPTPMGQVGGGYRNMNIYGY